MPTITVIPATKTLHSKLPADTPARRRVAAYARVSTDSEEQFTSYEAQVDYRIPERHMRYVSLFFFENVPLPSRYADTIA